jgi:H+-transporting ATPase
MDFHADEYTALQKYISTYRDPKAIDNPDNAAKDGADAKKGKAWWQVR